MTKTNKKGFTIVELVIVIAVIAILAAVLIPTFSSLVSKANLSADMQAVHQMNTALQADETLHGRPTTIDGAMRVIANAGYDADNWTCLTAGYRVYWYAIDNRCVLYNATTGSVEYPTEYAADIFMKNPTAFYVYNQTYKNALSQDFGFSSASATVDTTGVGLGSGAAGDVEITLGSSSGAEQTVTLGSAIVDNLDKFGITFDSAKAYGYNTQNQNGAVLESVAIYDTDPEFTSSSEIKANVFHISVPEASTPQEQAAAEKAAGAIVYSLFVQINNGDVANDSNIVIDGGTTLNVSGREWQGAKLFSGYFGTSDAEHPIVIDGMGLSKATSYVNTYTFEGSTSTYYLCGFFGGVTSKAGEKTIIENITFKNVSIVDPASDYAIATDKYSGDSNCAGIIGGIIGTRDNQDIDVTLRNITVDSSCSVKGISRVGGLVAYIGGRSVNGQNVGCGGKITIEGCEVNCDVTTSKSVAYGTCGGIVGFINKMQGRNLDVTIKNCKYSGKLTGVYVGGIVAQWSPTTVDNIAIDCHLTLDNVYSNATYALNEYYYNGKYDSTFGYIIGVVATDNGGVTITKARYAVSSDVDSPEYSVTCTKGNPEKVTFETPYIGK